MKLTYSTLIKIILSSGILSLLCPFIFLKPMYSSFDHDVITGYVPNITMLWPFIVSAVLFLLVTIWEEEIKNFLKSN